MAFKVKFIIYALKKGGRKCEKKNNLTYANGLQENVKMETDIKISLEMVYNE